MSDKNDNLVKNSFFSVVQIVSTTLCLLIVYFMIIRKLGKAELGAWSIITSLPVAISVFGSGVSGCILRHIPVYVVKKDCKAFNEIIFTGLLFNLALGGVIVVSGYLFSREILEVLFSRKDFPPLYTDVFRLALAMLLVNFMSSVLVSTVDGLQLIHIRNKIMIAGSAALCISGTLFIQFWSLKGVLFAQLTQSLLVMGLLAFVLIKEPFFSFKHLRFNRIYFRLFLTYGQGFQVISISILLFEPITKYFLNKYFNLSIVGIYDLVNRIVIQVRTLIVSAVQTIVPMVSMNSEQGTLNVDGVYQKTNRGATLLSFSLYSSVVCVGMFAVTFLDPDHILIYLFMTLFMITASHFNIISSTAYSILMGLGKLKDVIFSHVISSVVNVLLFIFLRHFLNDALMVLPVSASIIISSVYMLSAFKRQMSLTHQKWGSSDINIIFLAVLTVLLTVGICLLRLNQWCFLVLSFIHVSLMFYLMFRNDFFYSLARKILNLKN